MTATYAETVVYARRGTTELALDVFRPETESRRCAILLLHGRGRWLGSKDFMHARARALARGFTTVAV